MLYDSLLVGMARALSALYIMAFFLGGNTLMANRLCFVAFDLLSFTTKTLQWQLSRWFVPADVGLGQVPTASFIVILRAFAKSTPKSRKESRAQQRNFRRAACRGFAHRK